MTYIPLTRCAALAYAARAQTRPRPGTIVPVRAAKLAHHLLGMEAEARLTHIAVLDDEVLLDVMTVLDLYADGPYVLWHDTISGFAEDVLGLTLTDTQRAALEAVVAPDACRAAVRAPYPDNELLAAVLMVWVVLARCSRRMPQVAVSSEAWFGAGRSLWRVIARFVDNASLPGSLDLRARAWHQSDRGGARWLAAFAVCTTDPYAFAGLPPYAIVVSDASRISDPGGRAVLEHLDLVAYSRNRLVALAGDEQPEEWFTQYAARPDVTAVDAGDTTAGGDAT
ncbi:hypothetical protein ABZV65_30635 [Streptomyces bauhiniae]|uniref:hypothetical protein n=1 Tax=Streptomyces bauhiniae TaxID=2340725 RepID=UPI0033A7D492